MVKYIIGDVDELLYLNGGRDSVFSNVKREIAHHPKCVRLEITGIRSRVKVN